MAEPTNNPDNITEAQMDILHVIKQHSGATNAAIAALLDVTYEAVRQQLRLLETLQLVEPEQEPRRSGGAGRPTQVYVLTPAGENLFPKAYDELVVDLIDTVSAALGPEALEQVLASITDEKVHALAPQLQDKSLPERLEALKGFYLKEDAYMEVDEASSGRPLRLIERNCPFLNVATRRPALCSVTVSALSRLLGHEVTREKKFQDGDGRCVFLVHENRPVNPAAFRFGFEKGINPIHEHADEERKTPPVSNRTGLP